jgi:8-hydroxy-5-deazaflavin:NADPH oxidoreductase
MSTLGPDATPDHRLPARRCSCGAERPRWASRAAAKLISASGFAPVNIGGIDQSIRIEVGGDLHEFGKLGRPVSAAEAKALV